MLLFFQNVLYCLLYIGLVKWVARNNGLNCLFFYPKEYIDEAQKRGLADKDASMRKGKHFMTAFCLIIFVALVFILAVWNRITDFATAWRQAYLFLVVVNWFDGIVIDRLWVGHSKIWRIAGMEGVPYTKPWKTVLVKRSLATLLYLPISALVAEVVVLVGKTVF